MSDQEARLVLKDLNLKFPLMGMHSLFKSPLRKKAGAVGGKIERNDGGGYVHVLRDINLTVNKGDRIALTGHNGAGKSSLLRVLAGIYPPTSGEIQRMGRVTAILNPMAGMQPFATGYENIWMRGTLQGMSNDEIENAIPDIEEFTELGDYLNVPLERYSTGMRLRLAFAVATCQKPDIVLIDETVNAGDQKFRDKSKERLRAFLGDSGALILASHSEKVIRAYCDRIIRLDKGQIEFVRPVRKGDGNWD